MADTSRVEAIARARDLLREAIEAIPEIVDLVAQWKLLSDDIARLSSLPPTKLETTSVEHPKGGVVFLDDLLDDIDIGSQVAGDDFIARLFASQPKEVVRVRDGVRLEVANLERVRLATAERLRVIFHEPPREKKGGPPRREPAEEQAILELGRVKVKPSRVLALIGDDIAEFRKAKMDAGLRDFKTLRPTLRDVRKLINRQDGEKPEDD